MTALDEYTINPLRAASLRPIKGTTMTTTATTANPLLEYLKREFDLKNDAALARKLEVAPPVISKIHHGRLPVGASLLLRMHEEFGTPISTLKSYLQVSAA